MQQPAAETTEPKAQKQAKIQQLEKYGRWFRIKIGAKTSNTDQRFVPVNFGSEHWEFRRNEVYIVPERVLRILENASYKQPVYQFTGPDQTKVEIEMEQVSRYNFQVLEEVSVETAAQWWREKHNRTLPHLPADRKRPR